MIRKVAATSNKPREIAIDILGRIEQENAFAEPLLDARLGSGLMDNPGDRRLLTQIVYGTLRMQGRIDWIIGHLYSGRFVSMNPGIKSILRSALYQLLFTDRLPDYAVVNEAVNAAGKRYPGREGLVNAVLRNAIRKKDAIPYPDPQKEPSLYVSVVHSHPLWLVEMWIKTLGLEEATELCRANNEIPPLTMRVNSIKTNRREAMARISSEGSEARETLFSPDGLTLTTSVTALRNAGYCREGLVLPQDEASQIISRLVDPMPGQSVLDMCAGFGGKTTHLAALMKNSGRITAVDINGNKLAALRELSLKLGATNIDTLTADASGDLGLPSGKIFDRILADVPCSGLGTLRRNPEIKWRLKAAEIKKYKSLQRKILVNASRYLRKGGILVYSTCTINTAENEDNIKEFLSGRDGYEFVCSPSLPIDRGLIDGQGFFRTFPHKHGMDGFFGAVLKRR